MSYYGNTPVVRDAFARTHVEAFDDQDLIGVPQGFQSLFGNPATGAETIYSPDKNTVEISIMRGNDKIAALVPRGGLPGFDADSRQLVEPKQSLFDRVYPLIEQLSPMHAYQLSFAMPNESPDQRVSREDRMVWLANRLVKEQQRRIGRTYEYLASKSIITGKMPALYETADTAYLYDFLRPSTHTVAAGTVWATGDPEANLVAASDYIIADAHVKPDYAIMAADSFAGLRDNENIQALADVRRFEIVNIGTSGVLPARYARMVANGFTHVGRLLLKNGVDLQLFIYTEQYTNPSDTATLYLPSGNTVLGWTGARCDRYFGPPESMPMGPNAAADYKALFGFNLQSPPVAPNVKPGNVFDPASLFVDAYRDDKEKCVAIRTQAAPIFATTMTDAFAVITGCA